MGTNMKTGLIFLGIFVVLAILGGAVLLIIPSSTQSGQPPQCEIQNTGTIFNSYSCSSNVDSCEVTVTLDCQTQTSQPNVVLRVSNQASFPDEVAIDSNGDGNLDRWRLTSTRTTQNICFNQDRIEDGIISGSWFVFFNGKIIACTGGDNFKYTSNGASIPIDNSPIDSYASTGREKYSGTQNLFQCQEQITGDVTSTVTYSDNVAGSTTKTITINPGQTINWNGRIDFTEIELRASECTQNQADANDPSKYYICSQDQFGCGFLDTSNPQFCDGNDIYNEQTQQCQAPYSLQVTPDKSLFAINEPITGDIAILDTADRAFKEVRITLQNAFGQVKDTVVVSTNSRGDAPFTLDGQTLIGQYSVVAETQGHPLGDVTTQSLITIENPIFLRLNPEPDQIQFNSNPIKAKAFVTNIDGQPENANSWDFTGTKCGSRDVSDTVQITRIKTGEYLLATDVNEECTFVYQVRAIDQSGFTSETDIVTIQVKQASITISPDLTTIQDKDAGRHTLTFRTLDTNQQPIESTNDVVVIDSDACRTGEFCFIDNKQIPAIQVTGSNGEYQFTHDFKDGLNTIQITSFAQGIDSTTQEFIVNLFPGTGCLPGDPCDGPDGFPVGTVVTIVLVAGGLFLFFWLVLRKRKGGGR